MHKLVLAIVPKGGDVHELLEPYKTESNKTFVIKVPRREIVRTAKSMILEPDSAINDLRELGHYDLALMRRRNLERDAKGNLGAYENLQAEYDWYRIQTEGDIPEIDEKGQRRQTAVTTRRQLDVDQFPLIQERAFTRFWNDWNGTDDTRWNCGVWLRQLGFTVQRRRRGWTRVQMPDSVNPHHTMYVPHLSQEWLRTHCYWSFGWLHFDIVDRKGWHRYPQWDFSFALQKRPAALKRWCQTALQRYVLKAAPDSLLCQVDVHY